MKKVLGIIAVLVLGFVGFIATRPGTSHIERSTTIAAPSHIVFAQVADFHAWRAWSPWEGLDPNMTKTIEGQGVGASYYWSGNDKVGEGRMTIISEEPNETLAIKLEFLKPWQATNTTTFAFDADGDGTLVTWSMDGKNNFMMKAMGLFMNLDKVVGADYEKGLGQLKTVAEAAWSAVPADTMTGAGS